MNRLIHIVAAAMFVPLSLGCGASTTLDEEAPNRHEPLAQGVFGRVTKSVGNFFCCPPTGKSSVIFSSTATS